MFGHDAPGFGADVGVFDLGEDGLESAFLFDFRGDGLLFRLFLE